MSTFKSQAGKLKRQEIEKTIIKPMTRTPEYLNSDNEESLRKSIERDDEIEFQDDNRWTDRLRKLQIIKEVQKNFR